MLQRYRVATLAKIVLVMLTLVLGGKMIGGTAAKAQQPSRAYTLTHNRMMDSKTCIALYQAMAVSPKVSAAAARLAHPSQKDCTITASLTVFPMQSPVREVAVSGSVWCNTYTASESIGAAGGANLRVGLCGNGVSVWMSWGPDCSQWSFPGVYGNGNTWCGVWNNGGAYVDPGSNWYIYLLTEPSI